MGNNDSLDKDLELLARIIIRNLKHEFALKHLSGNLARTIKVSRNANNQISIHIPAQTYNMLVYQKTGVIVYNGQGSYASKLDTEGSKFFVYPKNMRSGSFQIKPGNHKGYINKIINESIVEWNGMVGHKIKKMEDK